MADWKILATRLILAVFAVVIAAPCANAQSDWRVITSASDARRLVVVGDSLFAMTSGGILRITDPGQPGEILTNVDGFRTPDIRDLLLGADGTRWVAGNGYLTRWRGDDRKAYLFADPDDRLIPLLRVAEDGTRLWVGSQIGLLLFSTVIDDGQIEDSYTLFGTMNPSPAVYDIALTTDSIWLATSAGLAVADRRNRILMKSPAAWRTWNSAQFPEMGGDTVRRVIQFQSDLYIATSRGPFRFDRLAADTVDLTPVPFGTGGMCYDLQIEGASLALYCDSGVAMYDGAIAARIATPGFNNKPRTGALFNGARWLAANNSGLWYDNSGTYTAYPYVGLPANDPMGVARDQNHTLTVALSSRGFARQTGPLWTEQTFFTRIINVMQSSADGRLYVGTEGNGVWQSANNALTKYGETNSTLIGIPGAPGFIVTRGLAIDNGYLFAGSYRALNGAFVAVGKLADLSSPANWTSFGFTDGLIDSFIVAVAAADNWLAVGTESRGLFRYYYGPDPFDHADDSVLQLTEANSFLRADAVKSVAYSPSGELWVGTSFGLSRYDELRGVLGEFFDVDLPPGIGPTVTALAFDSRGNLWIGTNSGLARRDAVTGEVAGYTTRSSDLVSDDIRALSYDAATGDLYVSTPSGLTVIPSEIGPPTTEVDSVVAFPNPFVITQPADRLRFNFAGAFNLRIFTAAGEKVYETDLGEWDGRNQSGEPANSGVYLWVLRDRSGQVKTGKVLLVRR